MNRQVVRHFPMSLLSNVEKLELQGTQRDTKKNKKGKKHRKQKIKGWQIANHQREEDANSNGYGPRPLPDPELVEERETPCWFLEVSNILLSELKLICQFEYRNWDWAYDFETGKQALNKYLTVSIPKVKQRKSPKSPRLMFSMNLRTCKYIQGVELIYIQQNENDSEVLLRFFGDYEHPNEATYLIIWLTSNTVENMQMIRRNVENEFHYPADVANYFMPLDLRKNPENYQKFSNSYIRRDRYPCRVCGRSSYFITLNCKHRKSFTSPKSPRTSVTFLAESPLYERERSVIRNTKRASKMT